MNPRLTIRRRIGDLETPVGALLKLGADRPGTFLFESIAGGERLGRYSFIGLDPLSWFRIRHGKPEFSRSADFHDAEPWDMAPVDALRRYVMMGRVDNEPGLPPMASGAFGYVGYDMIQYVEPVGISAPDQLDVPETLMMIPRVLIIFDHIRQEILLVGRSETPEDDIDGHLDDIEMRMAQPGAPPPASATPETVKFISDTSPERYFEMVEQARRLIRAGDIFQAVLSQRFSAPYTRRPISLYRALRRLNPSDFMFYMQLGDVKLVGSSPEILVRLRNGRVTIRPIAGTRPRVGREPEDTQAADSLLNDPKERAEHLMLLDLGRNDVGRVAAFGSVQVTQKFVVERYSHVMHIVSNVEGDIRPPLDAVDALFAGFPAGTVSGAPKIRAMQIIDELETHRRGIYAGAVGYFGWNGDLDSCIALRTAVIKDGRIHIQTGGGIVLDSDPQYEFDETLHKAGALMRAAELSAIYEDAP
jgi:anthranilate synthase component 1